jgi:hypothetical protein
MTRMLLLVAMPLLFAASPANAQYVRGQMGGATNVYPAGTLAWSVGANGTRSAYFYMPQVVNYGYGPAYYNNFTPNYYPSYGSGYYVAPNGGGGG